MTLSASMDTVRIRPMAADDVDQVRAIAEGLETVPHWPRCAYDAALESSAVLPRIALVAQDGGRVVGFAIASLVPPEAELETIAVAPIHQRRGVGAALLSALLEELRSRGIVEATLEVRASNLAAQAFYRAYRFAEFARREKYYGDTGEAAIVMRTTITISPERG